MLCPQSAVHTVRPHIDPSVFIQSFVAPAPVPKARVETRVDSAFFSEAIVDALDGAGVEFTASVPFERFPVLKTIIDRRRRRRRIDEELSFFETQWKPKSWSERCRFVFIRKRVRRQNKAPIQLNLFEPHEEGYDFKVIVTNKRVQTTPCVRIDVASSCPEVQGGRGSKNAVFRGAESEGGRTCSGR